MSTLVGWSLFFQKILLHCGGHSAKMLIIVQTSFCINLHSPIVIFICRVMIFLLMWKDIFIWTFIVSNLNLTSTCTRKIMVIASTWIGFVTPRRDYDLIVFLFSLFWLFCLSIEFVLFVSNDALALLFIFFFLMAHNMSGEILFVLILLLKSVE